MSPSSRRRCRLLGLVLLACAPAAGKVAHAVTPGSEPVLACGDLTNPDLVTPSGKQVAFNLIPDAITRILKADIVKASGKVPEYCAASGYIANSIGIELHMPTHGWNGKFAMNGCGGMCGYIQEQACDSALIHGYSCIFTDMGHHSTQTDAEWAYNNLEGLIDFGYRSTHLAAVAGKVVTATYYGRAPTRSYYMGCSTGGRQGYVEAERYPLDFNGIIAGSPPMSEMGNMMSIIWAIRTLNDSDGHPIVSADQLRMVHRAALDACDGLDGIKDGVIGNVEACHFDPHKLVCAGGGTSSCLSRAQADAVEKVYQGPRDSAGHAIYAGFPPGTEVSWIKAYLNPQPGPGSDPHVKVASHYATFMNSQIRNMAFFPSAGPTYSIDKLDFDHDPDRMRTVGTLMDAQDPDLHAFRDAGGKFIGFSGWGDPLVPPKPSADFARAVAREMGGFAEAQKFFRLFMEPGVYHCQNGDGPYATDYLTALENWVEKGHAPDSVLIVRPRDPKVGVFPDFFTQGPGKLADNTEARPIFPYPAVATYDGKGDPNKASSFVARINPAR